MNIAIKRWGVLIIAVVFLFCFTSSVIAEDERCCCYAYLAILTEEYPEACLNVLGEPDFEHCGCCFIGHTIGGGPLECIADDDCDGPQQVSCGELVLVEFEAYYYADCTPCICTPPPLPAGYEYYIQCNEWTCLNMALDPVECFCPASAIAP